ncbi:MAG: DUF6159 family protein [Pseudomonadota bacterium]
MFERFSRSWSLVKASAGVLAQDKELLVFPLVASVASLVVAAGFVLPMVGLGAFDGLDRVAEGDADPLLIGWAFCFYVAQYFVMFFFQSALVGAAMIRLQGGDPTVGDGFRIAFSRLGPILGYAVIAATVGMLLRALQERAGAIGRWVGGLLGVAWTVATYMVVPILVTREVGPLEAVQESARLLKRSWGENVIGQGGIGLGVGLLQFMLILIGALFIAGSAASQSTGLLVVAIAGTVVAVILVALVQTALSGIYAAALYRHATGAPAAPGFDQGLLAGAFAPK